MKLLVFTVYDKAVQAYLPPFHCRSKGEALRSFSDACNTPDNNFHKHASDYSLVYLGEWEDGSGVYNAQDPVRVISALECLADDPFSKDTELPPRVNSGGRVAM